MIDTVIFDLGGVLIDWNPRYLYRKLIADEAQMEHFLSTVCTSEWNNEQDAGRPWAEAVEVLQAQFPERHDWIAAYADRWPEMLGLEVPGVPEVLTEVKSRARAVYALTNWSAETFHHAEERFRFLDLFDGIVVSGRINMKKPDPRIYHHLLDTHSIEPGGAVFIDDNADNIRVAREVGLSGILFEDAPSLRNQLVALGVLG